MYLQTNRYDDSLSLRNDGKYQEPNGATKVAPFFLPGVVRSSSTTKDDGVNRLGPDYPSSDME